MAVDKLVVEILMLLYKFDLNINQDLENSKQLLNRTPGTSGKILKHNLFD